MVTPTQNPTQNRETAALEAPGVTRRDAFAVLDHRSRRLAVSREHALPGPHLAIPDLTGGEHLVALDRPRTAIGRGGAADIVLDDARISRRHAIITIEDGHARVLDDRSSHGTFVNGQRVVSADLNDGDELRLGPVVLRYVVVR
jgi:hypothetical protein